MAAILAWFIIVDFPESIRNTFLTMEEKAAVKSRLAQDHGYEEGEKVTWKIIGNTMLDWKVWSL